MQSIRHRGECTRHAPVVLEGGAGIHMPRDVRDRVHVAEPRSVIPLRRCHDVSGGCNAGLGEDLRILQGHIAGHAKVGGHGVGSVAEEDGTPG